MRGIVLIAAGHPLYTHYAYNLALSIRVRSDIPIVLFYQGDGITYLFDDQKAVFSDRFEIPLEYYAVGDRHEYIKIKTHLYEMTPFDETIFLDADMILSPFKNIEDLFNENKDCNIQFACRGDKKMSEGIHSEWVNLKEVAAIFDIDHWYELSSEVIYWKQSEQAQAVFETAKYYYSHHGMDRKRWVNGKLEIKDNAIMEFAGGIPDEVPFGIALEKCGVKIRSPYLPSYWQPYYFTKIHSEIDIQKNFYLISTGGATKQTNIERLYNNLCKHYSQQTEKKRVPYQLQEKRKLISERNKI